MSIINFITDNYINILLILGLVLAIFISKSYKRFYSITLLILSFVSLIFLIFANFENNATINDDNSNVHKLFFLILFVIQPIELLLFVLSFNDFNKKRLILLSVPCLLNVLIILLFGSSDLILRFNDGIVIPGILFYFELVICFLYLLYSIICGIIYIAKKEVRLGLILILSSITNVFSLIIGANRLTFDVANSSILFSGVLVFISIYIKEQTLSSANQEKMIQEQRTELTISQIQPHFLYNSLATIGYICKKDPNTASIAIDHFSDYLRANLNSIKKKENVPFLEELKHVKTYVWLEQLRFEERLKVEYDIQYTDFLVPSLSIQPLVENAIKHGICNKIEGGKLIIRTIEYLEYVKVVIEDNGVGFDANLNLNDGKTHVGIENVKSRLKSMSNAILEIRSDIGKGTICTITFNKEVSK